MSRLAGDLAAYVGELARATSQSADSFLRDLWTVLNQDAKAPARYLVAAAVR
jgi:hypothetical protein